MFLLTSTRLLSFFCSATFYLYEWKSVTPLKVRALRKSSPVYFRLQATFFDKRCRASMTQHRQQSTRVRAKGIDPTQSHLCSSLSHPYPLGIRGGIGGWPPCRMATFPSQSFTFLWEMPPPLKGVRWTIFENLVATTKPEKLDISG